jgi:hypothetical protein
MDTQEQAKTFDHKKGSTSDRIAVVSELEHARRHAIRSAIVLYTEEKPEEAFKFLVWAKQLQDMRRAYMGKHFANIDTKHWCLCKSTACLRQLAYEVEGDDCEFLTEIDNLVDQVWGDALGEDLSDCEACKDDKKSAFDEPVPDN